MPNKSDLKHYVKSTAPHWHSGRSSLMMGWQLVAFLMPFWALKLWAYPFQSALQFFLAGTIALIAIALRVLVRGREEWNDLPRILFLLLLLTFLFPVGVSLFFLAFGMAALILIRACFGQIGENLFHPVVAVYALFLTTLPEEASRGLCYNKWLFSENGFLYSAWLIQIIVSAGLIYLRLISWRMFTGFSVAMLLGNQWFMHVDVQQASSVFIFFTASFLFSLHEYGPSGRRAQWIVSIGTGVLACYFSSTLSYVESMVYASLLAGAFTFSIDMMCQRAPLTSSELVKGTIF